MRALAGIVVGLVAGFLATIIIGIVGGMIYPSPAGVEIANARQIIEAFVEMPLGAKVALMLAWFGGALVGAFVAKLIARSAWPAWTVTGLIAAYVVANTFVLPMPGWMQALSIAAPLIGGLIANHLVRDGVPDAVDAADMSADA